MTGYANNIVLDFEFTPVPREMREGKFRDEIIEIGAVRVNEHGEKLDSFNRLVKPTMASGVSPTVSSITGITDGQLCQADTLEVVLYEFVEWIELGASRGNGRTRIVSWDKNDQRVLTLECAVKGIEIPGCMKRWLDLQVVYPRMMEVGRARRKMSLKDALGWDGDAFDSKKAHRALYDAERTAELMGQLLSGEYRQQKQALGAIRSYEQESKPVSASLGSRCSALADLYKAMTSGAAACAA